MACGCKNKGAKAANSVVKSTPTATAQESTPEKPSSGNRIIKREIR